MTWRIVSIILIGLTAIFLEGMPKPNFFQFWIFLQTPNLWPNLVMFLANLMFAFILKQIFFNLTFLIQLINWFSSIQVLIYFIDIFTIEGHILFGLRQGLIVDQALQICIGWVSQRLTNWLAKHCKCAQRICKVLQIFACTEKCGISLTYFSVIDQRKCVCGFCF